MRQSSRAERFKLSNEDRARLEDLVDAREKIVSYLSIREVRKLLYRLDRAAFQGSRVPALGRGPEAFERHAMARAAGAWPSLATSRLSAHRRAM